MPDVAGASAPAGDSGDPRVAALVGLVRAVARREPMAGYAIEAGPGGAVAGAEFPERFRIIETWRGTGAFARARFAAHVIEAHGAVAQAADLAGTVPGVAGRAAAIWLAAPGTGPHGGRLAVVVTEPEDAGRAEDGP